MANPCKVAKKSVLTLPLEIVDDIFIKLPARSLVRFKCVSKYYSTLISSPKFTALQLRQSLSSDTNRLLLVTRPHLCALHSIEVDSSDCPAFKIRLPPFLEKGLIWPITIVGSINGLVCLGIKSLLYGRYYASYDRHVLINPSTGMYRIIPRSDIQILSAEESFGIAFDDINNDYKLVRIAVNCEDEHYHFPYRRKVAMVYSLNSNSWKLIENIHQPNETLDSSNSPVLINNYLLHWIFWDSSHQFCVRCFDVRFDKWVNDVPLVDVYDHMKLELSGLGVIDECLCVSTVNPSSMVIWIMKDYGVKESWVKLFEIPNSGRPYVNNNGFIGWRKLYKHEIILQGVPTMNFELTWYNIEHLNSGVTNRIENIQTCMMEKACLFKGSLVLIPNGQKLQTLDTKVLSKTMEGLIDSHSAVVKTIRDGQPFFLVGTVVGVGCSQLQINVDAAWKRNGRAGVGFVSFDSGGSYIFSHYYHISAVGSLQAEAKGIRGVLRWAFSNDYHHVSVNSDCLSVILRLVGLNEKVCHELWDIVEEIHQLSPLFHCLSFCYIPGKLNVNAHQLARKALR